LSNRITNKAAMPGGNSMVDEREMSRAAGFLVDPGAITMDRHGAAKIHLTSRCWRIADQEG
jgi:hypothetical protein